MDNKKRTSNFTKASWLSEGLEYKTESPWDYKGGVTSMRGLEDFYKVDCNKGFFEVTIQDSNDVLINRTFLTMKSTVNFVNAIYQADMKCYLGKAYGRK